MHSQADTGPAQAEPPFTIPGPSVRFRNLIIAMVVQHYRLQLVPGQHIEPDPIFTLRPSTGVQVTLHAR